MADLDLLIRSKMNFAETDLEMIAACIQMLKLLY